MNDERKKLIGMFRLCLNESSSCCLVVVPTDKDKLFGEKWPNLLFFNSAFGKSIPKSTFFQVQMKRGVMENECTALIGLIYPHDPQRGVGLIFLAS